MDSIENLRRRYYEAIVLLQDEQDIIDALPQPEYQSFFPIITGLIKLLDEEMLSLQQELKNNQTDYDMKEYIEEEINMLLYKKELCISLLKKGTEEEKTEEDADKISKKNIIFAATASGNICIENDLKGIPEEQYKEAIKMLQDLQHDFVRMNNNQKAKKLTKDKKIAGLREIKEFQIRLFYKIISADTVYVLLFKTKKADWDSIDRKYAIIRAARCNKQFNQLKEQIKDPETKEKIISENEKILNDIYNYLEQNKRGIK